MFNKRYFPNTDFFFTKEKGFTLIELLVVISIIAVLTTLLMANFIGIRQRGRDGERKSNVYSVQSALELYRSDVGLYPLEVNCDDALSYNSTVYMQQVPCDPLTGESYVYSSDDGATYTITACLENRNDSDADDILDPSCPEASFTVTNP